MDSEINPLVLGIIAITAVVSFLARGENQLFRDLEFNLSGIRKGQWHRLLSSALLHVSLEHLLFNMITLFFFAETVISVLGNVRFLGIYVLSTLAGSLLSLVFHYREPEYRAVGASGAVTGILYSSILLNPGMELFIIPIPIPIPAYLFGIGYLLYSLYGMQSRRDNIGHSAHFGGAIGGYGLTLAFQPGLLQTNSLMVILLAIPIVLLLLIPRGRN